MDRRPVELLYWHCVKEGDVNIIVFAIIAYIVPTVLSYLSGKKINSDTESIYCFTMRCVKEIASVGWVGAGFFLFCIIGSSIAKQFDGFLMVVFGGLFLLGVLLILVTVEGFWEVKVEDNKVTRRILWVFNKTILISDIDYCIYNRGGYQIFVKGSKRKAIGIDGYFCNTENWEKRMDIEGIEIRER